MNSRGQIAIFVALIFQVLFVLFAMVINVALIVHDKINLQNSVDLAAYYAAQRQAEMLNVIAHENYMIRQSWKLLAWRQRVLGTQAYESPPSPGSKNDYSEGESPVAGVSPGHEPIVCVAQDAWKETPRNESTCSNKNLKIPEMPRVETIAGFIPLNPAMTILADRLKDLAKSRCDHAGAYNWWFAAAILHAFRIDQANRKEVIFALSNNLTKGDDFVDLNGDSVYEGAFKTLMRNLTYTNETSEGGIKFEMLNSLKGVRREELFSEVQVAPMLQFIDYGPGDACEAVVRNVFETSLLRQSANVFILGPQGEAGKRIAEATRMASGFLANQTAQFSLGVEKNPWYMAYVGIKAATRPRQIFAPFGPTVVLEARAFAKPFGGRIGPWYGWTWSRGSQRSGLAPKLDGLVPERVRPEGFLEEPNGMARRPNYSRFPADVLGAGSKLAQVAMMFFSKHQSAGCVSPMLCKGVLSFADYSNIVTDFGVGATQANDILPWTMEGQLAPFVRDYEIAALAPDLFDITYYSIEPNFAVNYLKKLRENREKLGIPSNLALRGDLGSRGGTQALEDFSVQDQINKSNELAVRRPEAFYFVRDQFHLLTAWVPGLEAFSNYPQTPPNETFARCEKPDTDLKIKVPGSCAAGGGRTGYSVKLVSRDMLLNGNFEDLGGKGESGQILNPPGDGW